MSDAEVRAEIRTRVKEQEPKILAEHRKKGQPFGLRRPSARSAASSGLPPRTAGTSTT
jgi:hypothetical protein